MGFVKKQRRILSTPLPLWERERTCVVERLNASICTSTLFVEDLVDRNHRQGAAAAGIVDSGYGVDGFVDHPYRKAVPGRDHARGARPRVGRGIIDFVRTKYA